MNALIKLFGMLALISLLVSGCAAQPAQAGQGDRAVPKTAVYESILGKPLNDEDVAEFLAGNQCSSVDHFLLCNDTGMALWVDSNQVVETVYIYLNGAEGVVPYKGELPYGLKFYDIKDAVEYKLKKQGVGKDGLPDEGVTPDHLHYWATYHEAGMTIIYNSPSMDDEDASIYAILVSK